MDCLSMSSYTSVTIVKSGFLAHPVHYKYLYRMRSPIDYTESTLSIWHS